MAKNQSKYNRILAGAVAITLWLMNTCISATSTDIYFQNLNQKIVQITQSIQAGPNVSPRSLYTISDRIDSLTAQAKECVEQGQQSLGSLNALLIKVMPSSGKSNSTLSYNLLLDKISMNKQRILDCSLFIEDLSTQQKSIHRLISTLPNSVFLDRVLPIWKIQSLTLKKSIQEISYTLFFKNSGLSQLNQFQINICIWYLIGWLVCAVFIYSIYGLRNIVPEKYLPWYGLIRQITVFLLPICLFYVMLLYMFTAPPAQPSILTIISYACAGTLAVCLMRALLTIYVEHIYLNNASQYYHLYSTILFPMSAVLMINISRHMSLDQSPHVSFDSPFVCGIVYTAIVVKLLTTILTPNILVFSLSQAHKIYKYACALITAIIYDMMVAGFAEIFGTSPQVLWFVDFFSHALINALMLRIIWIILSTEATQRWILQLKNQMIAVYILMIILGSCGYHILASMLIFNLLATGIIIWLLVDNFKFLHNLYNNLSEPTQRLSIRLRALIGIKSEHKLVELYIFIIFLYFTITVISLIAIIYIWHLLSIQFAIHDFFVHSVTGYSVFGVVIYPLSVLRSICVFSLWIFLGRIFISFVILKKISFESPHTQKQAISIVNFIFLTLGILIFLTINHVSLKSFVVIAGALSFGIGFGFQNLAADLISGWLLLVNKPFRAGDHILVGNANITEGVVCNIGALSTHLITATKADTFIPNSTFTNTAVVNLTYQTNKLSRITLHILLDDLADSNLAKELLFSVAAKNKQIKHSGSEAPQVLFNYHGADLSVVIINIENKNVIISELISEIEKTFIDQQVKMTFGNQD